MRSTLVITPEAFEALLSWLHPSQEIAGQRYETIRSGLIRVFVSQGFNDAEDLADLTINRVIARLPDIRDSYVGEPANYFHGVARNVIHEARRRKEFATGVLPVAAVLREHTDDAYDCLLKCLKLLPSDKREMVLDFYLYDKRDKIVHHKRMAQALGITESNLRLRVHRARETLEKCVLLCMKSLA
jgi:RNA polymerase sigma factor (sigma-70 family)